jgi:predicted GNAT superfamily acetyltransferase
MGYNGCGTDMTSADVTFTDLHTHEDFVAVVELQRAIWGRDDDNIPAWVLAASMERGAILIGAEVGGHLVGFVYSVPGFKRTAPDADVLDRHVSDHHAPHREGEASAPPPGAAGPGQPLQWSHMLGVLPAHRAGGLGHRLKLAQRARTLAQGVDLVEWTFDPLVATNGKLNVTRLGAVVEEYLENVYGASASPLHGGLPTDRFVASWRIASPHVARRLDAGAIVARDASVAATPAVIETTVSGAWRMPVGEPRLDGGEARLFVEIPYGFVDMLREAPADALIWRLTTRRIFTTCFARGYRVVDFIGSRESGRGGYLLQRREDAAPTEK